MMSDFDAQGIPHPPWKPRPASPAAAPKAPAAPKAAPAPKAPAAPKAAPAPRQPATPKAAPRTTSPSPARKGAALHGKITGAAGSVQKASAATSTGKPSAVRSAGTGAAAGALAGAEIGSIFPGIGTAIGAGVGAAAGGGAGLIKGHSAKKAARQAKRAAQGAGRKVLISEFLVCMVILGLSPLTDKHKTEGPRDFLERATAICLLFFVLGLVASAGRGASRAAAGLGALVTATLLVSSRDELTKIAELLGGGANSQDPGAPLSGDTLGIDNTSTAAAGLGPDGTTLSDTGTGGGFLGPAGN